MKTKNVRWRPAAGGTISAARGGFLRRESGFTFHGSAFTLTELLVVIAIIAILAAFILPVAGVVKRHQYIENAQAEMGQLETAITAYKDALGFYPPDNPANPMINQLYYELEGTTNSGTTYQTLDGSVSIPFASVKNAFGVGGFVNCSQPGSNEETGGGRDFIRGLKPNQTATISSGGASVTIFVTSVGGPDGSYNPLNINGMGGVNPWRYKSSGTLANNPGAYELWVQLSIAGKKYLVCNWSKEQQVNNPLP